MKKSTQIESTVIQSIRKMGDYYSRVRLENLLSLLDPDAELSSPILVQLISLCNDRSTSENQIKELLELL